MNHTPRSNRKVSEIVVRQSDLPMVLRIEDDYGNTAEYSLNPAGRKKIGASLGSIPELTKKILAQR